jgi:hypothetical protein
VRRSADRLAVAFLTLVVLVLWADVLVGRKSLYIRDVARVYIPERAVLRTILMGGELPLWNPHFGGGQPLAANPAFEAFYPPQWLALLPSFPIGVHVEIVFHALLAAIGMFLFLRTLRLRVQAAVFGALTFALGGLIVSSTNLFPFLFSVAWWPWIALFLRRALDDRRPRDFALAALALGAMFLAAEQSMILQAGALIAAYAGYRLRLRGIAMAILIGAAAVLIGAVQLIPALDFQRDSGRATPLPYDVASSWSMAPLRPLELIVPSVFGRFTPEAVYFWASDHPSHIPWLFSWYSGMLAAALAIAGFVHRIRGWIFTAAVCAVSYAFAVYPLVYRLGFHSIRYPEKFFFAGAFMLIVFAAIAADRFLVDASFRRTTLLVSVGFIFVAAGALAFAYSPLFPRVWHLTGYFEDLLREAREGGMTTLMTASALALILLLRERPRIALPLLCAFVLADLGPRGYGLAPRIDGHFYDAPAIASKIPPGARLYNDAAWRVMMLPQPRIAYDDRWPRMRNAMFTEMQALWGFDSVLELDVTGTMLLPSGELSRAFWNAELGGHGDVARQILDIAGVTYVIALRDSTSPTDPATVVPFHGQGPWRIEGPGRILRAHQSANTMDFDVDAAGISRLVMAVTRHRYWQATIDGVPATIRPANIAFQAIDIPPGRHAVAMRYWNPLVVICGAVSLISALFLAVVALRSKAPPPPLPH